MTIPPFKLEEFWKTYEFSAPYLLCCSDAETWAMRDILQLADAECRELWDSLALGYTESPGHPLLRQEIAKLYPTLRADNVLTLAGAEEGIYCTLRTLLEPGDHAIVIDPCYQSLATLPQSFGASVTAVPLREQNGWKVDVSEVKAAFRQNTKVLILNEPHNPTGTLLDRTSRDALTNIAREHGAYIFCDEVYRYMEIDESRRLPSIADVYEKGISLNVMTKSFGLAGLRIAWIATPDVKLLNDVNGYKLYTSICNSAPSEILALIALRAKDHLLARNRGILLHNFKVMQEFIQRNDQQLSWVPPLGGTVAVVKLRLDVSVDVFAKDLVEKTGVLIMPGSVFDLPGNYFRIGLGRKNMPAILERFELFLRQ